MKTYAVIYRSDSSYEDLAELIPAESAGDAQQACWDRLMESGHEGVVVKNAYLFQPIKGV